MLGVGGSLNSPTCNNNVAEIFNQFSQKNFKLLKRLFQIHYILWQPTLQNCHFEIFVIFAKSEHILKKILFNLAKNLNSWHHCHSPWFPPTARLFFDAEGLNF
jgi:hypothetical protein